MADRVSFDIEQLVETLKKNVKVKKRTYHMQSFAKCFVGKEAVDYMVNSGMVNSRDDAVDIGIIMQEAKLLKHVTGDRDFQDGNFFYRFAADEPDHGKTEVDWTEFQATADAGDPKRKSVNGDFVMEHTPVTPLDEHNIKLLNLVKPAKWIDPKPKGRYNLVVIGAGAGGLVTAAGSAGLGARVALIEEHLLGGDCLNVGCVPSKALIRCARAAREIKNAAEYGVELDQSSVTVNFGKVMERMRKLRASIAPVDSAQRMTKDVGIDVFQGHAKFVGGNKVVVNGQTLTFSKACVATGGRAFVPPIPGIKDVEFLNNSSLFNLTELPKRFGVIGGGPIGVEMAQSFAAFGSEVTLYEVGDKILSREDKDAAAIIEEWISKDGVKLCTGVKISKISQTGSGQGNKKISITYTKGGTVVTDELDELLVSTGRIPNVEGLGLEKAGVKYHKRTGIEVDDYLRSTNKNIFAVGDCCTKYQFTHVADFMARKVIRNALFLKPVAKMSDMLIPWCTYTSPEISHVGKYEKELLEEGVAYDTYVQELADVDRAILEGDREKAGFVKIVCKKGKPKIIGATIVAENAGDLISEVSVAIQNKVGIDKIAGVIHPYPTVAEAIRKCGDQYARKGLTPTSKALLRYLMKKQR